MPLAIVEPEKRARERHSRSLLHVFREMAV